MAEPYSLGHDPWSARANGAAASSAGSDTLTPPAPAEPRRRSGKTKPYKLAGEGDASGKKKSVSPTPPKRRDRMMSWLALAACLALAALPMAVGLDYPVMLSDREAAVVERSMRTWSHVPEQWPSALAVDEFEAITPRGPSGQPRLDTPPGTTWLHLLALNFVGDEPWQPHTSLLAARLVSLVCALLLIASVYWAGMSLGRVGTAAPAALACAALAVVIYFGRLAGEDMPRVAFTTLAVAGGLWAIRPMKPAAKLWRQAVGWLVAGIALGAATLVGGLTASMLACLALLMLVMLCPRRIGHLMGLIAAVALGSLIVMPWMMYAHSQDAQLWTAWFESSLPYGPVSLPQWTASLGQASVALMLMLLPWTLWTVAALIQPFSTSSQGTRPHLFLGWSWFVLWTVLVIVALYAQDPTSLLWLCPAAAVLVGQFFRQLHDLSAEGRHARAWRWLRWIHVVAVVVLSLAIPAVGQWQGELVEAGHLSEPIFADMAWGYWFSLGVALLLLALLSGRYAARHYPRPAVGAWAVWTLVALTALAMPLIRGPRLHDEPTVVRQPAAADDAARVPAEPDDPSRA